MAARWLLVRHGPTRWSAGGEGSRGAARRADSPEAGRYAGWSDVPLSDEAREQTARLGRRLVGETLRLAYSSDLARARETLALLLRGRTPAPEVRLDPDLRELHFGAWEGLTYAAIAREPEGPAVLAGERRAPGGESLDDLAGRVARHLDRLRRDAAAWPDATTLVVAHGGPLRVLLCLVLGVPPARHWRFQVDHLSLSEVAWDPAPGGRLVRLNDRCHLLGARAR